MIYSSFLYLKLLKSVVAELQEIPVVKENLLTVNLNGEYLVRLATHL